MEQEMPADRNALARQRFDARVRAAIRPLITAELIAEHQRDPLGNHSDALKRVLNYLRRGATLTPYVVICTRPFREWRLARATGERGKAPAFVDAPPFDSERDVMHALFLKRIEEVMRD